MLVVICYDVATSDKAGARRLRRIAPGLLRLRDPRPILGVRVSPQASGLGGVFARDLLREFDGERDSLRFYLINSQDAERTEHHGVREPVNPTEALIV